MLIEYNNIPTGFLDCHSEQAGEVLGGPSLIHLTGNRPEPVFVSVLLHGNENVGLTAVQNFLRGYLDKGLPRSLSIFVGNVAAARRNVRRLDSQPDYNRVWPVPGESIRDGEEAAMMAYITDIMRRRKCFLSLDIHNNTGLNPYYALVNRLQPQFLQLATMFNRTVVYTIKPNGTQAMAFLEFCPALTLECGKVGDLYGLRMVETYLQTCLSLVEVPAQPLRPRDYDLFHSVATVKVDPALSYGIGDQKADVCFREDLDHLNFQELSEGTVLASIHSDIGDFLQVFDEDGNRINDRYFDTSGEVLTLARPAIPAMLTLDTHIVRQDCLCYLMERMANPAGLDSE